MDIMVLDMEPQKIKPIELKFAILVIIWKTKNEW